MTNLALVMTNLSYDRSMLKFPVRQARAFLEVAKRGGVTRAAAVLNKSQTSVTRAIRDFERSLGFELFKRSSRGMELTAYGEVFHPKAAAALEQFQAARELVPPETLNASLGAARLFRMDVSDQWLDALVAAVETQNVAAAANQLGITPAAVNVSLRKLEDSLGMPLFERSAMTLDSTAFAKGVVRHVKLARNLLRQGVEEMASIQGATHGRVVVGTLPFVRTVIVPTAVMRLLDAHSELRIATKEAPYADLITDLRCGDVDILVGALRGASADADVEEEQLIEDKLSVIVRAGHPLLKRSALSWADLLAFPWVLPRGGIPTRDLLNARLSERGLSEPKRLVESSSFIIQRALVMDSDRLTVLSRHQCRREERAGLLACLDFELPGTARPIGITRHAHHDLSPAAALLAEEVRRATAELL